MSKIDQNQNRVLTLRHISSKKRDKKKCFWRSIFFCLWHFLITARVDDDDVQVEFEIICNDFLFSTWCWWQTVWLDLAKFRHFVQFLNAFFDFRRPKLLIGKILKTYLPKICYWANFHLSEWPNFAKYSSHLVTLMTATKSKKIRCKGLSINWRCGMDNGPTSQRPRVWT